MSKSLNLVLLYGGKSGEHEVSLHSAASVLANLNVDKYHIIPVAIDKEGHYHLHSYEDLLAYKDKLPVKTDRSKELNSLEFDKVDVVFPVIHGPLYEDGCLQGLLELANVAFVGCDVLSSALGMDKDIARRLVCINGLKSARYKTLQGNTSTTEKQQICKEAAHEFCWPLFVKPCSLGSSVGIHKVKNAQELWAAVQDAFRYDSEILIEEFIKGREIELAVLENTEAPNKPRVSIAGEILANNSEGFYSYSAKYLDSGQTDLIIPAQLSTSLKNQLEEAAAQIFTRLKCKGLARVDFFVDDQKEIIYFSEINTLPGFTSISMYPKLWVASGLPYFQLLDELISIALAHQQCRQQLVTSYS